MTRTGRVWLAAAAAIGCLALAAPPAGATWFPGLRWAGSSGRDGLVGAIPSNLGAVDPGAVTPAPGNVVDWESLSERGGRALAISVQTPLGSRLGIGAELRADDLLTLVWREHTPTGSTVDVNEALHRAMWSLGWRLDGDLWSSKDWRGMIPPSRLIATGTTGMWRISDDRLRRRLRQEDAFGWSLGLGWFVQLPGRVGAGPAVRYTRVFNDRVGRVVTGSIDWIWR